MATTAGAARRAAFGALAATWDAAKPREAIEAGVVRGLDLLGDVRGRRAIDLGAGPGRLEPFLLSRLGSGDVLAIDFAPEMVVRGAMEVRDPRVTWLCRDVLETGLPDACADLVLCFNAWAHFPDGPGVLREARRWLTPGGRILLWHDLGRERLAEVHRRAGHAVSGDILPPVEAVAADAREAGLVVESAVEDDRSWTLLARRPG